MFILIIFSYLMMGITTVLLFLTGYQGLAKTDIIGLTHPLLGLLTVLVFAFTETFTLTFISVFIKSIKQTVNEDSSAILSKLRSTVYRNGLISIVWITTVFLLGGAADTNLVSPFLHGTMFFLGLIHYLYILKLQYQAIEHCVLLTNKIIISEDL